MRMIYMTSSDIKITGVCWKRVDGSRTVTERLTLATSTVVVRLANKYRYSRLKLIEVDSCSPGEGYVHS